MPGCERELVDGALLDARAQAGRILWREARQRALRPGALVTVKAGRAGSTRDLHQSGRGYVLAVDSGGIGSYSTYWLINYQRKYKDHDGSDRRGPAQRDLRRAGQLDAASDPGPSSRG